MARSMFSLGMFSFLPAKIAVRKRGLEFGSPPPMRAAMVISRIICVNAWPRLASVAAFLCLMVAHFECPDMTHPRLFHVTAALPGHRWKNFCPAERIRRRLAAAFPYIISTDVRSPRETTPCAETYG